MRAARPPRPAPSGPRRFALRRTWRRRGTRWSGLGTVVAAHDGGPTAAAARQPGSMRQVVQRQRDGHLAVVDVPAPTLRAGGVLVRTEFALISAGTERAKVDLARKSLLGKARARPEQARRAVEAARQEGVVSAYRKVTNRLAMLEPLGYSCAGTVIGVGAGAEKLAVGDRVACAGAGFANHAEVNFVP